MASEFDFHEYINAHVLKGEVEVDKFCNTKFCRSKKFKQSAAVLVFFRCQFLLKPSLRKTSYLHFRITEVDVNMYHTLGLSRMIGHREKPLFSYV